MWSVKQAIRLCSLGEEHSLPSGCLVLDKSSITSIREAVDNLNAGAIACPQGICSAYSASHQSYHLLYRSDMRDKAQSLQSDFKRRSYSSVSSFTNFAILDGAWSTKNVLRLCCDGEEQPYIGVIPLLDGNTITSVMDAVCRLNRRDIECPQGYCMVYSTSRQAYYLLYHCQVKHDVLARFRPAVDSRGPPSGAASQRSLGRSPSANLSVSDVGTSGGDSWSSKRVARLCGEGEEGLFDGRAMLIAGSLSVSDAVAKLNRGDVDCPEGFCVVFSASRRAYFLLFRAGLRDIALATCNGDMEPSVVPPVVYGSSPARGYPSGKILSSSSLAVSSLSNRAIPKNSPNRSWSLKQAYRICSEGEEWRLRGRVHILDKSQLASVSEAVQMLQSSDVCPEGLCVAYSAKQKTWYLLYEASKKDDAVSLLANIGACKI